MVIQYIVTGAILIILSQLFVKFLHDKTVIFKFIFWAVLWGVVLIVIWMPKIYLDSIGQFFGIGEGIDLLVYLSIIILFYIIFRLSSHIEKLEKEITKLVRELAKRKTTV
jgi:hypothetical protein